MSEASDRLRACLKVREGIMTGDVYLVLRELDAESQWCADVEQANRIAQDLRAQMTERAEEAERTRDSAQAASTRDLEEFREAAAQSERFRQALVKTHTQRIEAERKLEAARQALRSIPDIPDFWVAMAAMASGVLAQIGVDGPSASMELPAREKDNG